LNQKKNLFFKKKDPFTEKIHLIIKLKNYDSNS